MFGEIPGGIGEQRGGILESAQGIFSKRRYVRAET